MKLIDLLVQELPKRGGWPRRVDALVQSSQGAVYKAGGGFPVTFTYLADDWDLAEVTREQYEAALAASKKVEWDGEGLPPVGCECQIIIGKNGDLGACEVIFMGSKIVVWRQKSTFVEGSSIIQRVTFRPIRSEADKKREIGVTALALAMGSAPFIYGDRMNDGRLVAYGVYDLYDKIAAGEVAGIRIE